MKSTGRWGFAHLHPMVDAVYPLGREMKGADLFVMVVKPKGVGRQ